MNVSEVMMKIFVCRGVKNNPLIKWYSCTLCLLCAFKFFKFIFLKFGLNFSMHDLVLELRGLLSDYLLIIRSYTGS